MYETIDHQINGRPCLILIPEIPPEGENEYQRQEYAVLYLLHGQFDHLNFWFEHGGVEDALNLLPPCIVIMPLCVVEELAGDLRRQQAEPNAMRFQEELNNIKQSLQDLLPEEISFDETRQAVLGISMGAKQAIPFAFNNSDISAIGLLSAKLQGGFMQETLNATSCYRTRGEPGLQARAQEFNLFYHYCGREGRDGATFWQPNSNFFQLLFENNNSRLHSNPDGEPGNHNWIAWHRELRIFFEQLAEIWQ